MAWKLNTTIWSLHEGSLHRTRNKREHTIEQAYYIHNSDVVPCIFLLSGTHTFAGHYCLFRVGSILFFSCSENLMVPRGKNTHPTILPVESERRKNRKLPIGSWSKSVWFKTSLDDDDYFALLLLLLRSKTKDEALAMDEKRSRRWRRRRTFDHWLEAPENMLEGGNNK